MDCKAMLQGVFDHARNNPPGDFPGQETVFVTATLHQTNDALAKTRDIVHYANGPVTLKKIPLKGEVLNGDLQMYVNEVALVELKQKPGTISLGPVEDIFPYSPNYILRVSINANGFVSAQQLAAGNPFAGPPVTFQTTCTNGLLTAVVNNTSYTFSFTLRKKPL